MSRARDIEELEVLLNNAESADKLCNQAIEIIERLVEEKRKARYRNDHAREQTLREQERDFQNVLEEIERRRHASTLDKFKEYCRTH